MRTTRDLWLATGRTARHGAKRRLAFLAVLLSGPALLAGGWLARLPAIDVAGMARPAAWVLDPLRAAWWADRDVALLGYLALQVLLLAIVWAPLGGAVLRLAACDLAARQREPASVATSRVRERWRALIGARVLLVAGVLVPVLLAAVLALPGRLPGALGDLLAVLAVAVAVLLGLVAALFLAVLLLAGFLAGAAIVVEAGGAFEGVARAFTYAGAGPLRLTGLRLLFLGGALLGALGGLGRTLAVAAAAWLALRLGLGPDALEGALDVLRAGGLPDDAARLGLGGGDVALAAALALAGTVLLLRWLADLATRLLCARVAVYLLVRRRVDHEPLEHLAVAPTARVHRDATTAGFVEVDRVDEG